MRISIFGAGYVGLVTGACLAELGNEVLACDTDSDKIKKLKNLKSPFYEPGLEEIIQRNVKQGRLKFTGDSAETVKFGEIIFIAVGTPPAENGEANLTHVLEVAKIIGENLDKDQVVVVIKSTVPAGTSFEVKKIISNEIKRRTKEFTFSIANNPEFLREGKAIEDFMTPDRVVIGTENERAKTALSDLYLPLTKNGHPLYFMDIVSSEMTKYAANAFLAARVSLINELSQVCEKVGADVEKIRIAAGSDRRIGQQYLYPGIGYGGSCFPKDIQALVSMAKKYNYDATLVRAIDETNEKQKQAFAQKIVEYFKSRKAKLIALWGLAFKPHTDDMRFAPSLHIIEKLLAAGLKIIAYDPAALETAKKILGDKITYGSGMYEILSGADALVIITEWPQFKEPDFAKIKSLLGQAVIFDGRNLYEPEKLKESGFTYFCIGRPSTL